MRVLLDTCTFLWIVKGTPHLSQRARTLVEAPETEVLLSVVSHWEIGLKAGIGKLSLAESAHAFVLRNRQRHGIDSLPLDESAFAHLERLPPHHRDPFDRLLICQAIADGLVLLTPDPAIQRYPVRTLW